jgi:hypothetical protein
LQAIQPNQLSAGGDGGQRLKSLMLRRIHPLLVFGLTLLDGQLNLAANAVPHAHLRVGADL